MSDFEPMKNELFLDTHPGLKEAWETMRINDRPFRFLPGPVEPGDTYMGEHTSGVHVYEAFEIATDGYVVPLDIDGEIIPAFECFKIALIKE